MKIISVFLPVWIFLLTHSQAQSPVVPLPNAHAHNDYEHERPLLDALEHGFTSIEADIHLINGELYVSHDKPDPGKASTLQELYLEPLRQIVKKHGGWVYSDYPKPILLLIDIKTDAEATYQLLRQQLVNYPDLLGQNLKGKTATAPVRIVLSGNRPIETIRKEQTWIVFLDGRPADAEGSNPTEMMPLISTNFVHLSHWNGGGEMPAADFRKIQELAAKVHNSGKKLRLWATPESETAWATLLKAGVDYLNTDQLARLQTFLLGQQPKK